MRYLSHRESALSGVDEGYHTWYVFGIEYTTVLISVKLQARAQLVQLILVREASVKSLLFACFSIFSSGKHVGVVNYITLVEVISFLRILTCGAFSMFSQELVRGESHVDSLSGQKDLLT